MDIEKIKSIVNNSLIPDEAKEYLILEVLSKDDNVIPYMMKVLENERAFKQQVHEDMNVLLSQAHTVIEEPKFNADGHVQKKIVDFYTKYRGYVGHCFINLFKTKTDEQDTRSTAH